MEGNNRRRGFPEVMVLSQSMTRGLELNSERDFLNLQAVFVKGKQQPKNQHSTALLFDWPRFLLALADYQSLSKMLPL